MMELVLEDNELKAVTYFCRKAPSQMSDRVLSTPLQLGIFASDIP